MVKFGFQKLEIYQLAKELVLENYRNTNSFPEKEKYALIQQMNRAAISIPSNISEGYARDSVKEKCHFINMAYGSMMELVCQYEISRDLEYVDEEIFNKFSKDAYKLAIKLSNFRTYLKGKPQN
jgi:four helix bundle protein